MTTAECRHGNMKARTTAALPTLFNNAGQDATSKMASRVKFGLWVGSKQDDWHRRRRCTRVSRDLESSADALLKKRRPACWSAQLGENLWRRLISGALATAVPALFLYIFRAQLQRVSIFNTRKMHL
jgi:hypothetical protein